MAPASAERQWKPRVNPWVIAATVALAAFMEVLDTSVANVALPHISGNLGVSTDDGTWVLTSYLVSNAIVLPMGAWASSVIGRKRFLIGKGEYMKIRQLVDDAFDRWGAGKGSILDLMGDDGTVVIPGTAPHCGTRGKQEFVTNVATPFMSRFSKPPVPVASKIMADGDDVIIVAEADGTTLDGKIYHNSYVFVLEFREDRLMKATEFLDMVALNKLWDSVQPKAQATGGMEEAQ
jgi:ketosteroid isomerase-like protein